MMSPARIRSLAIMIRFTFQWSTNTPATGPMIARGNRYAMLTAVTCTGVPCQRKVIKAITPNRARKSPKILTNWASQRVRNGLSRRIVFSGYAGGGVEVAITGENFSSSLLCRLPQQKALSLFSAAENLIGYRAQQAV